MYDIEYAYLTETPVFVRKRIYEDAAAVIEKHQEKIFECYASMDLEYCKYLAEATSEEGQRIYALENRKCYYCNADLRYIQSHDFWGCTDYQKPGEHSKHTGFEPTVKMYFKSFNDQWLTDIIKYADIYGEVNTKELYQWLITENGYEDLLLKFELKDSKLKFQTYEKTRLRSINQELVALKYLDTIYSKVIYQQCITYKLKDKRETFCIPDFICSISDEVHVIDAKLDYAKDKKMHLYVELVTVVLRSKDDKRKVKGLHILNDEVIESDFDFIQIPHN